MKFRVVMALAALALSACGPSPSAGLLESHIAKDTPSSFVVCGNYGCSQRWDMLMTDAEWDQVRAIFADPAFKEKWLEIGSEVVVGTPEQFEALIKTEARKMESLIKGLNIQLD